MSFLDRWRRVDEIELEVDQTEFQSLGSAIPLLKKFDYRPEATNLREQIIVPVENDFGNYDLTLTHDREASGLYLGAELHPAAPMNKELAVDLLRENGRLNNAKLALEANEGQDTYRILAINEIRTPQLTNEQVVDEIRSFDAAVTFEYRQIRGLASKNGIELPELPARNRGSGLTALPWEDETVE